MNPEDQVLDRIDQLVNESLARPITDDYDNPWLERCEVCHDEWHGLAHEYNGCPGAYADDDAIEQWKEQRAQRLAGRGWGSSIDWGQMPVLPPERQFPRPSNAPRVRLWTSHNGQIFELRGRFNITTFTQTADSITYEGTLLPDRDTGIAYTQAAYEGPEPLAVPEGFVDIGYIERNIEIRSETTYGARAFNTRIADSFTTTLTFTQTPTNTTALNALFEQATHDAQRAGHTYVDQIERVQLSSGTTGYTLADLEGMRSDRAQYAGPYAYTEHFTTNTHFTHTHCAQCQRYMSPMPCPAHSTTTCTCTPRTCDDCTTMQRTAHARTQANWQRMSDALQTLGMTDPQGITYQRTPPTQQC